MSAPTLEPGTLIAGRYRLDRHLGEGGMGTVWSATHAVTRREVALKLLRPALFDRTDLRKRFLDEARAASSLDHPNVIDVIDVFELEDSTPVMVMELLDGQTLGQRLARDERLSLEETAAIMVPVIEAVMKAHERGVVHRDLKPENVFLTRDRHDVGWVKVLDFGIAKLSAEHYAGQSQSPAVTQQGTVLGTPRYMAPEQLSNESVDQRADVWSLGAIIYECLSGTRAIEGEHMAEVVGRLLAGVIMPLSQLAPELPAELTSLVGRMLTRDPSRRHSDLYEVTETLARYRLREAAASPVRRRRNTPEPVRTNAPTIAATPVPVRGRRPLWIWGAVAACSIGSALVAQLVLDGATRPTQRVEAADTSRTLPSVHEPVVSTPLHESKPALLPPVEEPTPARVVESAPKRARRSRHKSVPVAQVPDNSADSSEASLFTGRK